MIFGNIGVQMRSVIRDTWTELREVAIGIESA